MTPIEICILSLLGESDNILKSLLSVQRIHVYTADTRKKVDHLMFSKTFGQTFKFFKILVQENANSSSEEKVVLLPTFVQIKAGDR